MLPTDPVFSLGADWQTVLPELTDEPALDLWRQAWRTWCQPRGLPATETETCRLDRQGHRLKVGSPPRLAERLRSSRSDALKGEAWLMAGEGRVRTASLIEIVEAEQEAPSQQV